MRIIQETKHLSIAAKTCNIRRPIWLKLSGPAYSYKSFLGRWFGTSGMHFLTLKLQANIIMTKLACNGALRAWAVQLLVNFQPSNESTSLSEDDISDPKLIASPDPRFAGLGFRVLTSPTSEIAETLVKNSADQGAFKLLRHKQVWCHYGEWQLVQPSILFYLVHSLHYYLDCRNLYQRINRIQILVILNSMHLLEYQHGFTVV